MGRGSGYADNGEQIPKERVWALLVFLLVWLPMFTGSLAILLLLDRLLLQHLPGLARWLGMEMKRRAALTSRPRPQRQVG